MGAADVLESSFRIIRCAAETNRDQQVSNSTAEGFAQVEVCSEEPPWKPTTATSAQ